MPCGAGLDPVPDPGEDGPQADQVTTGGFLKGGPDHRNEVRLDLGQELAARLGEGDQM